MALKRFFSVLFLLVVPAAEFLLLGRPNTSALPYGSGDYGACTYDTCSISLLTTGLVALNVTPTGSGVNTTAKDEVTVSTDATTGYTLTFTDSDTDTTLASGGNTIPASAGTQAGPITLAMNSWGYRVDGLAGFGAGPTSAQASDPSTAYTFAGVPASDQTAHTLKVTAVAANPPDVTEIWYGVRLDTTKQSGTYTGSVTYTAVTND